jgi:hypothetical protein
MSADLERQLASAKIAIRESLKRVDRLRRLLADLKDDDFEGSVGRIRALLAGIEEKLRSQVEDRDRIGRELGKGASESKPRSP